MSYRWLTPLSSLPRRVPRPVRRYSWPERTSANTNAVRSIAKVLAVPFSLTVSAALITALACRNLALADNSSVMTTLASFDGTAATIFAAFGALAVKPSGNTLVDFASRFSRTITAAYLAILAMTGFLLSTVALQYPQFGPWALGVNVSVLISIVWSFTQHRNLAS